MGLLLCLWLGDWCLFILLGLLVALVFFSDSVGHFWYLTSALVLKAGEIRWPISQFGKILSWEIGCRNSSVGSPMKKSKFTKQYARLLRALRDARQAAGMTQVEVAERFEAHAPFVSKCESGERRIDVVELAAFCRIYGITVSELLQSAGIE